MNGKGWRTVRWIGLQNRDDRIDQDRHVLGNGSSQGMASKSDTKSTILILERGENAGGREGDCGRRREGEGLHHYLEYLELWQ